MAEWGIIRSRREEIGWGLEQFTVWHIIRTKLVQVRLHRIYEPHRQSFFHNHPRHFASIVLGGGYLEARPGVKPRWRLPGSFTFRLRHAFHTVWHPHGRPSWSLVFFFGRKRPWEKMESIDFGVSRT